MRVSDFRTCGELASFISDLVKSRFLDLCLQIHPKSSAPSSTLRFETITDNDSWVGEFSYASGDFPEGDYWDEQLNDRTVVVGLLDAFGLQLPKGFSFPRHFVVDKHMATLCTKTDPASSCTASTTSTSSPRKLLTSVDSQASDPRDHLNMSAALPMCSSWVPEAQVSSSYPPNSGARH
jgi:hypothetical protein